MSTETAYLDIGYTNVTNDLNSCLSFDEDGNQNILNTLNNYEKLLNRTINVLTILKDSISKSESENIHLFSDGDELGINGNKEIIDRFIGFGIASISDEWTEEESNNDNEYSELSETS